MANVLITILSLADIKIRECFDLKMSCQVECNEGANQMMTSVVISGAPG